MMGAGFASCNDSEEDKPIIDPIEKPNYILNEGHWGANNASISMFNHPAFGIVQEDACHYSLGKHLLGQFQKLDD